MQNVLRNLVSLLTSAVGEPWRGQRSQHLRPPLFKVSICAALAGMKFFDNSKQQQQDGAWLVQVSSLRFGPLSGGPLPVDCSVLWRELPKGGVGINTNYLMDISPEWRSPGGPTYLESLKVLHASLYL